jgi:hypothetical protein
MEQLERLGTSGAPLLPVLRGVAAGGIGAYRVGILERQNGGQIASTASLGVIPISWTIVGTGDFNGDGNSDILWRDSSGNTAIWFLNGGQISSTASLGWCRLAGRLP